MTRDERVKILDFGLAKQTSTAVVGSESATLTSPTPTAAGMVLGTVGYMSPEQVRGQAVDHRSDIFGFGAILYEMVSGNRAFKGDSSVETMNAILKDEPSELTEGSLRVSPGLERIIRRCLEKAPERRFQSASDLAFAIEALSGSAGGIAAQPPTSALSGRPKWVRWLSGRGHSSCRRCGGRLARLREGESRGLGNVLFRQLSFQPEAIFDARFAPDGETVLYSSATEGNIQDLFIHRPDYPAPQSMGLHDVRLLSISTKGKWQSSPMLSILRNDSSGARCRKLR